MDILTSAANAVFSCDPEEELCIPLTPTKGKRAVFGELTNTISISPEKFADSPLRALFTAPTLTTPKTKSWGARGGGNSGLSGSKSVGRGHQGKSLSSPSAGYDATVRTPKRNGVNPDMETNSGGSGKSPLTPMSNLKLLTRIASMEESLTSKKVLFNFEKQVDVEAKKDLAPPLPATSSLSIAGSTSTFRRHNSDSMGQTNKSKMGRSTSLRKHPTSIDYSTPSSPGNLVMEGVGHIPSVDDASIRASEGSRKDKSLGLLSEKFLEHFPMEVSFLETPRRLVIDEVAAMLGTERRRVYDIINVLESLSMAARVQKNMYQWMGKLHLQETLGRLKALGQKLDIGAQLQALQHFDQDFKFPQRIRMSLQGEGEKTDTRREKSLGILCQKFLMLLLVSPEPHMISLDNAARMLVGEVGEDGERLRTRGRRLYDIANVLASLGLVRRVPTAKAFQYIGPQVEPITSEEANTLDALGILHRHSLLPSRLGSSGGKENLSSFGDHDVTPSNSVPPVQKRGRPRKLSTDFGTSIVPAAKKTKVQRTRSEDMPTANHMRKIVRHPSLHDICQVAEVERNKLLENERQQRSVSSGVSQSKNSREAISAAENDETVSGLAGFRPIDSTTQTSFRSLLQRRLTTRPKIPIALTFQNSQSEDPSTHISPEYKPLRPRYQIVTKPSFSMAKMIDINHKSLETNQGSQSAGPTAVTSATPRTVPVISQTSSFCPINVVALSDQRSCPPQSQQLKPIVVVKGGNRTVGVPDNQSRIVPVNSAGAQGTQVIKLITRTGGHMQQEPSTVITVLPASQTVNKITPQKAARHSGEFQHISQGIYINGKKVLSKASESLKPETHALTGQRHKPSQQCTVYSVSRNIGEKGFSRINSAEVLHMPTIGVPKHTAPSKLQQVSIPNAIGNSFSKGMIVRTSSFREGLPTSPPITSSNLLSNSETNIWQPSPESSSTDSELEQIFGDSFSYKRPRILVQTASAQSSDPTNQQV